MTISKAAEFLEQAFEALNKHYFNGELPKTIITIQSSPHAYGHFTQYDAWQERKKQYKEINIGAETLNRPIANTIATLVHEMVHLYCYENGIKDTSRGGVYHNKRFKEEAEKRGLVIEYDQRIGHSITAPSKDLLSFITSQKWRNTLTLNRIGEVGGEQKKRRKPSSTRKYACPDCGMSIRATKDVYIICGECQTVMEKQE